MPSRSLAGLPEVPEFTPGPDGMVEHNGLLLPGDMSDELKTLNVYIDKTSGKVRSFLFSHLLYKIIIFSHWNQHVACLHYVRKVKRPVLKL